jgi:arginine/ornithine N-succinyltransferase beta subunit
MNLTQGTKYTCSYLQRQQTVSLDQVVDESRPLPLSLQETANIEAYAQRNVISFFLFKNSVRMINKGEIYSQSRQKFLLLPQGPTKLCEHVLVYMRGSKHFWNPVTLK